MAQKGSTVTVSLPHHRYDVVIEPGVLSRVGDLVKSVAPHKQCAVFGDEAVFKIYGAAIVDSLQKAGYRVLASSFPSGEQSKNLNVVSDFYKRLVSEKFERKSPIIALGGGVSGDLVGFVASTYLRGVPLIQCPTSLLAMVDSSVGGKVGVNLPEGKNLIGSFYQPHSVIIDPLVLKSLSAREFRCGLAECVKHGILGDAPLFEWIEQHIQKILSLEPESLVELISRNVSLKASIVMQDEKEEGVRALLNLGHTFGHAIEATSGYGTYLHGEAVSLGLVAASFAAEKSGFAKETALKRVTDILTRIGLPVSGKLVKTEELIESMRLDKKVKDQKIRLVLPSRIGAAAVVADTPDEVVLGAWESIRSAS